jgi:hypothetical protein
MPVAGEVEQLTGSSIWGVNRQGGGAEGGLRHWGAELRGAGCSDRPGRRHPVAAGWCQGAAAQRRNEARMACAARGPGEAGPTDGGW